MANNGCPTHNVCVGCVAYDLIQGEVSSDEVSGVIKDSLKAGEVVSGGEVYTTDFSGFPPHTVHLRLMGDAIPPGISRDGLVTPAASAMLLISTERPLAKKQNKKKQRMDDQSY